MIIHGTLNKVLYCAKKQTINVYKQREIKYLQALSEKLCQPVCDKQCITEVVDTVRVLLVSHKPVASDTLLHTYMDSC